MNPWFDPMCVPCKVNHDREVAATHIAPWAPSDTKGLAVQWVPVCKQHADGWFDYSEVERGQLIKLP